MALRLPFAALEGDGGLPSAEVGWLTASYAFLRPYLYANAGLRFAAGRA